MEIENIIPRVNYLLQEPAGYLMFLSGDKTCLVDQSGKIVDHVTGEHQFVVSEDHAPCMFGRSILPTLKSDAVEAAERDGFRMKIAP